VGCWQSKEESGGAVLLAGLVSGAALAKERAQDLVWEKLMLRCCQSRTISKMFGCKFWGVPLVHTAASICLGQEKLREAGEPSWELRSKQGVALFLPGSAGPDCTARSHRREGFATGTIRVQS